MTQQARRRDRLAAGPSAAPGARRTLRELEPVVEAPVLRDARLLVSELVTNSVRHGRGGRFDAIEVCASVTPAAVRVEVRDFGPGFEPQIAAPDRDDQRMSGWGLYLLDELADRWGVHRGRGTLVWFELDRRRLSA